MAYWSIYISFYCDHGHNDEEKNLSMVPLFKGQSNGSWGYLFNMQNLCIFEKMLLLDIKLFLVPILLVTLIIQVSLVLLRASAPSALLLDHLYTLCPLESPDTMPLRELTVARIIFRRGLCFLTGLCIRYKQGGGGGRRPFIQRNHRGKGLSNLRWPIVLK